MALPRGAMGLSAVCDCGIFRSYSLSIFAISAYVYSDTSDTRSKIRRKEQRDSNQGKPVCGITVQIRYLSRPPT